MIKSGKLGNAGTDLLNQLEHVTQMKARSIFLILIIILRKTLLQTSASNYFMYFECLA